MRYPDDQRNVVQQVVLPVKHCRVGQIPQFGNGVRINQALDDEMLELRDLGMILKIVPALLPGDHASVGYPLWPSGQRLGRNDSGMDDSRAVVVSQVLEDVMKLIGMH